MKRTERFEHMATVEVDTDYYKGFYVDIIYDHTEECYNLWLFHESYGTKDFMVGFPKHNTHYGNEITETLESVLGSVDYLAEEHIPLYIEDRAADEERFCETLNG